MLFSIASYSQSRRIHYHVLEIAKDYYKDCLFMVLENPASIYYYTYSPKNVLLDSLSDYAEINVGDTIAIHLIADSNFKKLELTSSWRMPSYMVIYNHQIIVDSDTVKTLFYYSPDIRGRYIRKKDIIYHKTD